MTIIRSKRPPNHPDSILKNNKLSLSEKGLMMMYLSCDALPREFTEDQVKKYCSDDVGDIKETIKELVNLGLFEDE